jgi:asparagine N-glycosylation enzyme membrane subunit Stt3
LTQEIPWYLHRTRGGWQWLAAVLVIFHFVIPFLLLLQRPIKRNLGALGLVAGWIMFMRWIDTIWMIVPPLVPGFQIHWMDVAASIGIGGIWIGTFLRQLNNWPLLPVHDYRLKEVLANE